MASGFGEELKMTLNRFLSIYPLPQCAKVIEGYQDPDNDDNEFSANDFIEVTPACTTYCRPNMHFAELLWGLSFNPHTHETVTGDTSNALIQAYAYTLALSYTLAAVHICNVSVSSNIYSAES